MAINNSPLENNLPIILQDSIHMYVEIRERVANGEKCLHLDCIASNLDADINFAEAHREITSDQAWYLREKYLGDKKWF